MCALVTGVQTCARPISVVLKALAGGALVGTIIAGLMLWWVAKQKPPLHGAARFAKEGEIRRAGFRADDGIVLGKKGGKFMTFGGSEHCIVEAPTRSGKGVRIVIPNLLSWQASGIGRPSFRVIVFS